MERSGDARAGSILLIVLLVLSVAAFGVTRVLRSEDDIVNTVELSYDSFFNNGAVLKFDTTIDDADADVLVVDVDEERVRALQEGEPLAAGSHEFSWDLTDDGGELVPPGQYGLRVVLNEAGRDIVPPGSIIVDPAPEFTIERVRGGSGAGKP